MAPERSGSNPAARPRQADDTHFHRIAIVGIGLIGGSLGMAIRARGLADRVLGVDVSEKALTRSRALGAVDEVSHELDSLGNSDCVIFATPVGIIPGLMERASGHIASDALVTDVGSVKQRITGVGQRLFGERFVGGHPMAGSEMGGIEAARPDLFQGSPWALMVPNGEGCRNQAAASRIESMVRAIGGRPVHLTSAVHDRAVGLVSHLPHALSFAFSRAVAANSDSVPASQIAGPSFRDLSRVSQSSPELWADILSENRTELLSALDDFATSLQALRSAIDTDDRETLLACLQEGHKRF